MGTADGFDCREFGRFGFITMQLIYDLTFSELAGLLKDWDEPAYRARQVWQGLYQHLYSMPDNLRYPGPCVRKWQRI